MRIHRRQRRVVTLVTMGSLIGFAITADAQSDSTRRSGGPEVDVVVSGLASVQPSNDDYVGSPYLDRGLGGAVPGIAVSANVITARQFAAAVEFSTTAILDVAQRGRLVGGVTTGHLRDSFFTVLAGIATASTTHRVQVLAGLSRILGAPTLDSNQLTRAQRGALDPAPGRFAATGGVDLSQRVTRRLGIVGTLRYSYLRRSVSATQVGVGNHVFRGGVGIRFRLTHP
jgi:hypothetical protein